MTTYPLPTLAVQITDFGITAPSYNDILESLKASYRSIYGADVYLEADGQDGQWIAIQASAINDTNAAAIAVYNQFSPATARGAGLSSVVQINGITRQAASRSTVDVTVAGTVGTVITGGQVQDSTTGSIWDLPATVEIPIDGDIVVTATCTVDGATAAAAGAVTTIVTPTLGWQTVTNVAAATPGLPVETDATLRVRQARSTALPSVTPLKGLDGALSNLDGVSQLRIYENDTNATDGDGIPAHSIAVVVEGGDALAIAEVIELKKTLGCYTFGSTTQDVPDPYGVPTPIRFSRPTQVDINVDITLVPLDGYTSVIGEAIKTAVAAYIEALPIGQDVITSRLYMPANLYGGVGSETFTLSADAITIYKTGDPPSEADIAIAFDEIAVGSTSRVDITI